MKRLLLVLFYFALLLCGIIKSDLKAQDQNFIDSLETILKNHNTTKQEQQIKFPLLYDTTAAKILYDISKAYWGSDLDKAWEYANQSLKLSEEIEYKKGKGFAYNSMGVVSYLKGDYLQAKEWHQKALNIRIEIGDKKDIATSYNNIGNIYGDQGNYPEALKNYFTSLKLREEIGDKYGIAMAYGNIGIIYKAENNPSAALNYHIAALKIKEELGDKHGIADSYVNIGIIYMEKGDYTKALKNYYAALKITEELGHKFGIADSYVNLGNLFVNQGNYPEAFKYFSAALKIRQEVGDKYGIAFSCNQIGRVFIEEKKYKDAFRYLTRGLAIAKEIESMGLIEESYYYLFTLDSAQGNFNVALEHYKLHISYRDSLVNTENSKKTLALQMNYEFDKKQDSLIVVQLEKDFLSQKEVQKQKLIRNGFVGGFSIVLLFAGVFLRQRNRIKSEKKRSEELLLNILPEEVAEELKEKGSAEAKQFDDVTVMFTDFKGFTQISEKLSPSELVAEIHTCFKEFDRIITKHNIEKIKTIGDAYMCAGGLPVSNKTHPADVALAAMEIQKFMQEHLLQRKKDNKEVFEIRIGIHTGPVVAGIVGVKKFAYDIWGDTVNTASRMESSGEAGKVNISGATYELVKDKFNCIHRGKLEAKNKGKIDMYFVEGKI